MPENLTEPWEIFLSISDEHLKWLVSEEGLKPIIQSWDCTRATATAQSSARSLVFIIFLAQNRNDTAATART